MSIRALSVEQLESRMLLAGNVTASLSTTGDLWIEGSSDDDWLELKRIGIGQWEAIPANNTTLNGSLGPQIFRVRRDINVNLHEGNDSVGIKGQGVKKLADINSITIKAGSGIDLVVVENLALRSDLKMMGEADDDQLYLQNVAVPRSLVVEGNTGQDNVVLTNAAVSGDVSVNTGEQDDRITLNDGNYKQNVTLVGGPGNDNAYIFGSKINKNIQIDLGSTDEEEHDLLDIRRLSAGNDLQVFVGAGSDYLTIINAAIGRNVRVVGDKGPDVFSIGVSRVSGSMEIDMGYPGFLETDDVTVFSSNVGGSLRVTTGDGIDRIALASSVFKKGIEISMGVGNDTFEAHLLQALDRFYLDMGSGGDNVSVRDSTFRWASLDGGEGTNQLSWSNSRAKSLKLLNF